MLSDNNQYLTFRLGNELFAINVTQVREVLELTHVTKVPAAPAFMRGVVNVRGQAIPVIDLRLRLGLPVGGDTVHTRIIVMELSLEGEPAVLGGIADSVHEVIELEQTGVLPPPRIALQWRTGVIHGMARRGDDFVMILDVNAVFSGDELVTICATPDEDPQAIPAA